MHVYIYFESETALIKAITVPEKWQDKYKVSEIHNYKYNQTTEIYYWFFLLRSITKTLARRS